MRLRVPMLALFITFMGVLLLICRNSPEPIYDLPQPQVPLNQCVLPNVNPLDPEAIKFWLKPKSNDCNRTCHQIRNPVTVGDDYMLVVNEEECPLPRAYYKITHGNTSNCNYSLSRPMSCVAPEAYPFDRKIDSEFLTIKCDKSEYFLIHPIRDDDLVKRQQQKLDGRNRPINILGLGFDSMSHANYIRNLPETLAYLRTLLNTSGTWFEFNGYNIVGDGTTANLGGVLLGRGEEDLYEARKRINGSRTVDDWPWVWKNATQRGYVTAYLEDEPLMGAFATRLRGFAGKPTDHFITPFWKTVWQHPEKLPCHTGMWDWIRQLDYGTEFIRKYSDIPKFMVFFSKISHVECLNEMKRFDSILVQALEKINRAGGFENTFFFLFADHGPRYGPFRRTMQGKLEERLPGMFVKIPDWVAKEYPEISRNLKNNENRLFTPYDMHATLQHIINFPDVPKFLPYQQSLLNPISPLRTCEEAHINTHWCSCRQQRPVSITSQIIKGAELLVQELNSRLRLEGEDRCSELTLDQVIRVEAYEYPNQMVSFLSSKDADGRIPRYTVVRQSVLEYQIQFSVSPGGAILEGDFVKRDGVDFKIGSQFSRVNSYGDLKCMPKPHLREFCVCK